MLAPTMDDSKSVGKRLVESPSDEESGRIVKFFFFAATPTTTVAENQMTTDAIN